MGVEVPRAPGLYLSKSFLIGRVDFGVLVEAGAGHTERIACEAIECRAAPHRLVLSWLSF